MTQEALTSDVADREQFHRTALILGREGVVRLACARVMLVGLGAVGGYALEALARSGVGEFRIVDFDFVQESNINRQLLATHETVGRSKAELAAARIRAINPAARVEIRKTLVNQRNVEELFEAAWSEKPDYVVDAIDTLGPKVALIAETLRQGVPIVSSMGAALRVDSSAPRLGRLTEVTRCPLAAQLRKRLRRVGVNTDDVTCAYSSEPIRDALRAGVERFERVAPASPLVPDQAESPPGRPRNTLGSLPTIVGIFGLMIAHYVILKLSGFES